MLANFKHFNNIIRCYLDDEEDVKKDEEEQSASKDEQSGPSDEFVNRLFTQRFRNLDLSR